MTGNLKQLLSSPDFYPLDIDLEKRLLTFVKMDRDCYRNSSFLDVRTQRATEETFIIHADDLLSYYSAHASGRRALHYILHGAFSCSTLLARYLELCPSCFVLKEPLLLTALTRSWLQQDLSQAPIDDPRYKNWREMFALALKLLARTYNDDDIVFIKGNDICNAVAHLLLEEDARSKALFLMVPLKSFLVAILNSEGKRNWARTRLAQHGNDFSRFPVFEAVNITDLKDAEVAACLWLFYKTLSEELCAAFPANRIMAMNGEEVAEIPDEAVWSTCDFFGIQVTDAQLGRVLSDPSNSRHAKSLQPYNAQLRRIDLRRGEQQWKEEIAQGTAWCEAFAERNNLQLLLL